MYIYIYTSRLFNVFNAELHTDFRINKFTSENCMEERRVV